MVVIEEDLPQGGISECLRLVAEQLGRGVGASGEQENPQVSLEGDPAAAESTLVKPVEKSADAGREQVVAVDETAQALPGAAEVTDACGETGVDLPEGTGSRTWPMPAVTWKS